jgi:hypothetical protein
LKELDELGKDPITHYGHPRSIRIDAIEYREDGTVCVYDFKTGTAGVRSSRFNELAYVGYWSRRGINRAIVIEVRPRR